jgi:hypothetical protein
VFNIDKRVHCVNTIVQSHSRVVVDDVNAIVNQWPIDMAVKPTGNAAASQWALWSMLAVIARRSLGGDRTALAWR